MTTTEEKTIVELLYEVQALTIPGGEGRGRAGRLWQDATLGEALGVTGQTIHRWRHEGRTVAMPKLVRAALVEILGR